MAASTPTLPPPTSGTITIAIDGGVSAVYRFTATPFHYTRKAHPPTGLASALPADPQVGWTVAGTSNGKVLPFQYTTHDSSPLVAVRVWYGRLVNGGQG